VQLTSSGATGLDGILQSGVTAAPDIDGLATRGEREMAMMVWNYHDDDLPAPSAPIRLSVAGLPATATRVLVEHYRLDETHSNAYTVWQQMGSPQRPAPEQSARLEAAGQLQLLRSPEWMPVKEGKLDLAFGLPRQGVSLVKVSW
jgi:xylan 1,4-beta-xylosidase